MGLFGGIKGRRVFAEDTVLERYTTFRHGRYSKTSELLKKLGSDPSFNHALKAMERPPTQFLSRADDPYEFLKFKTEDPEATIEYFYQIRCNVTHRGKDGPDRDKALVKFGLEQMGRAFRMMFSNALRDSERHRERLIAEKL